MSDIVVFVRSHKRYGDQVVAYPALFQLKQWWPKKRLRVVSRFEVGHYYTELPWVDEFISVKGVVQHLRCLDRNTELSVNLHHSSERYGLVNMVRRPTMRMGFRNARLFDFAWTHHHQKDINEYIGFANLQMLAKHQTFSATVAAKQCFAEIAKPHIGKVDSADVVLIPGGGSGEFKRWSWRHYVALTDLLKSELGPSATFTFVLGPCEEAERACIGALARSDFRIEFGRSIPELAAIMLNARLVVANDCGPSHIAQGLCVPYVGVFNAPNPEWFWSKPQSLDVVPESGATDINSITPERVLQACRAVLAPVDATDTHAVLQLVS